MNIVLKRWEFSPKSTIGSLSIDGVFECFTIEDVERTGSKVPGETAVPHGTYRVTWERSPHLSKLAGHDVFTPRLHDVPGFEGVLIHSGNTADDSEGCIILGGTYLATQPDFVGKSRAACAEFYPKVEAAFARGESITITIGR